MCNMQSAQQMCHHILLLNKVKRVRLIEVLMISDSEALRQHNYTAIRMSLFLVL